MRVQTVNEWPDAVTDGLTLPCGVCDRFVAVDYRVSDDEWDRVISDEYRLGVVCFECFISYGGDPSTLIEAQFVGNGMTAVMAPAVAFRWSVGGDS